MAGYTFRLYHRSTQSGWFANHALQMSCKGRSTISKDLNGLRIFPKLTKFAGVVLLIPYFRIKIQDNV